MPHKGIAKSTKRLWKKGFTTTNRVYESADASMAINKALNKPKPSPEQLRALVGDTIDTTSRG